MLSNGQGSNGIQQEDSQKLASSIQSAAGNTKYGKKPEIGLPLRVTGSPKQKLLTEKIDFVIANGANGYVVLEETTGTGQRIELPRIDSIANMSVKTKTRFLPLTFRATMKDSSQQLFVNGKEELDVASEALSPYWLVVHAKGILNMIGNISLIQIRMLLFSIFISFHL